MIDAKEISFLTFMTMWNHLMSHDTTEASIRAAATLVKTNSQVYVREERGVGSTTMACLYVAWSLYQNPSKTFVYMTPMAMMRSVVTSCIKHIIEDMQEVAR